MPHQNDYCNQHSLPSAQPCCALLCSSRSALNSSAIRALTFLSQHWAKDPSSIEKLRSFSRVVSSHIPIEFGPLITLISVLRRRSTRPPSRRYPAKKWCGFDAFLRKVRIPSSIACGPELTRRIYRSTETGSIALMFTSGLGPSPSHTC
jgi:hypothetical protein